MTDIVPPRMGLLLRKLLELLVENPEGLQARDALELLRSRVELTAHEQGTYASGILRFDKIVRFGTIGCVKAGWMTKVKGRWTITDEGRAALARHRDPAEFIRVLRKRYAEWRSAQPGSEPPVTDDEDGSIEAEDARITFEAAEEQAWAEIEQHLRQMEPYDFQDLVADLLRALGYHPLSIAPKGRDGGVDVIAWSDPIGARPPRIKVQVKRRADTIPVENVREFLALLGPDDVGIFVTTSRFTKEAIELARSQESRKITLVDLERLFDLWVESYPKLSDEARRRFPLRPIWFLAPRV